MISALLWLCRDGGVPARVREASGDAGEGAQARPDDEAADAAALVSGVERPRVAEAP